MRTPRLFCSFLTTGFTLFGLSLSLQAADPPGPATVLVVAADPAAAEESSDPATFLVIRSGPTNVSLTIQLVLGGVAINGEDYERVPLTLTIPPGAWFAPLTITPIDDYVVERTEPVVVALQQPPQWPPPYIVTWPGVAHAEIADNDLAPTNLPPHVAIVSPPDQAIFDAFDDILLVARAVDPDGRVLSVEFFANDQSIGVVSNRPIAVVPELLARNTDDPSFGLDSDLFPVPNIDASTSLTLPHHLFRLVWANVPPGAYALTAVATDNDGDSTRSGPVNIKVLPVPPQPVVSIRAPDPVATEPNPFADYLDTATFTVHRTGPTNFPLQVWYRIGGTAINGVDYGELPRSLIIPAGRRTLDVLIEPLHDLLVEGTETVVLTIVPPICIEVFPPPPDCYIVGHAHSARAVILDNDLAPNQPPLVRLVSPQDGDVFLAAANIRLGALARDFDGFVTFVEFFEGTNSLGVVTPPTTADFAVFPPFSLVWSNVPPGRYVLTAVATDNDGATGISRPVEIKVLPHIVPPEVNLKVVDGIASETAPSTLPNTATIAVTRTGNIQPPLTVFYSVGGTASNGLDYKWLSGRVVIPSGAEATNVVIHPVDDNLFEGLETVAMKLEPSPILSPANTAPQWWYRLGSNSVARVVIRDNDEPPANLPPRVAILNPQEGEMFIAPTEIRLLAAAHDPDGFVRTVEFFDGTNSLGVVTNNLTAADLDEQGLTPEQLFRLPWPHPAVGPHVLSVKATDNRGASSRSEPVHIRVLPPFPQVVTIVGRDPYAAEGNAITPYPVNTDEPASSNLEPDTATFVVYRRGSTNIDLTVHYRLTGTASNGVDYALLSGRVVIPAGATAAPILVRPIDDRLPEPTETVIATVVAPACIAIYPPPPGCYLVGDPHSATAYIFDNDFNQSPKIEIVQPANGAIFKSGSDVPIEVVACDPDGWVPHVEFFAGTNKIGEQTVFFFVPPPPGQPQRFSMVWSNVLPGEHVLTAKAFDNRGGMTLSDPVRILVPLLPPLPVVTIEAVDPVALEPNPIATVLPDVAVFKVTRTGSQASPLTVFYRIAGTALNGKDYRELSGQVTIPTEAASAAIEIMPLHDFLVEGTESVILSLVQLPCITSDPDPNCYLVGEPSKDIAYIRDDDSPPGLPPSVALVSPPNGALFERPADIRLVAAAFDRDGWVVSVEFFAGNMSLGTVPNQVSILESQPVRLPTLDAEVLTENDMTRPFSLVWSNAPAGRQVLTAVATDNTGLKTKSRPVEITVVSPDHPQVVNIMALDAVAREGTTDAALIRIRRFGATNLPLTVFYQIRGTAVNGEDYVLIPHSVTIPAGRRSARILVEALEDNLPERVETVLLRLVPPPVGPDSYVIGRPAVAGAIILDKDCSVDSVLRLSDGNLHLRLPLPEGMPYRLEASTNLLDWEAVVIGLAAEPGASFVEVERADRPLRFYRIVQEFGDLLEE